MRTYWWVILLLLAALLLYSDPIQDFGSLTLFILNRGLLLGLIFSALILLRPVTNRMLRPKYRVALWCTGWLGCVFSFVLRTFGDLHLLPVTFRSLVTPRVDPNSSLRSNIPMYLPSNYTGAGTYSIAFPGGGEVYIHLNDTWMLILSLFFWSIMILLLVWDARQDRRLRHLGQQGEKMDPALLPQYGLDPANTVVRICQDLPTSFVRYGHDTNDKDGVRYVIHLQRELPPEQIGLVLLHESEHIRLSHTYYKTYLTAAMYFFWWNPILWVAYRLTCRDMELACDEGVLEKLEPAQQREYAMTLVELASGKPLWGAMTSFGECDAALRVKRVAAWKPQGEFSSAMLWIATAFLLLFFYTGQRPDWEITEIWYRTTEQLLVQDSEGNWYFCTFHQGENRYWVSNIREIDPPDLSQSYYHQLRLWED